MSNPSHYLSRNSPERAWIYPHPGFGSQEVTHSWNHMEESQAVSASDSKLIPDSHKGVLRPGHFPRAGIPPSVYGSHLWSLSSIPINRHVTFPGPCFPEQPVQSICFLSSFDTPSPQEESGPLQQQCYLQWRAGLEG